MCAASCTSCSNGVQFGIEYSLQSDGMANGNVALTFDGGSFDLNGDASYALNWQNTIKLSDVMNAPNLDTAKAAKDPTTAATAEKVDSWLEDNFRVSSAGGTYDIYIKGYIKETATGLTFQVDKHFTNIPQK